MKTPPITNASEASDRDLRTSCALALDEMVPWLREKVPDRVPPNTHDLVLATQAWTSSAAGEYARRLREEFTVNGAFARDRGGFKNPLETMLDELPQRLLQYNPSRKELAELRAAIDQAVAELRNPPRVRPLPFEWLAWAGELGLALKQARTSDEERATRDAAEELIQGELARRTRGDRLRDPIMLVLRRTALADGAPPLEAKRARRVLAVEGVLPAVTASSPYGIAEAKLREGAAFVPREAIEINAHSNAAHLIGRRVDIVGLRVVGWYLDLCTRLDFACPPAPDAIVSFESERQALDKTRNAMGFVPPLAEREKAKRELGGETATDRNETLYREAVAALSSTHTKLARNIGNAWRMEMETHRRALLDAFDVALAKVPIGAAFWYGHAIRNAIATLAETIRPETVDAMLSYRAELRIAP